MKSKKIKLFATQIPYTEEELEENEVYVQFDVEELLDQIESRDVYDYATCRFDLVNENDVAISLDDFHERELVEHLKDNYYNFAREVGEDEMIEYLEEYCGYTISDERNISKDYDYVDSCLFEDIVNKFHSLSVFDRQKMRDLIINL